MSAQKRLGYTLEEDERLHREVLEEAARSGLSIRGRSIYKKIEPSFPNRTARGLRAHYLGVCLSRFETNNDFGNGSAEKFETQLQHEAQETQFIPALSSSSISDSDLSIASPALARSKHHKLRMQLEEYEPDAGISSIAIDRLSHDKPELSAGEPLCQFDFESIEHPDELSSAMSPQDEAIYWVKHLQQLSNLPFEVVVYALFVHSGNVQAACDYIAAQDKEESGRFAWSTEEDIALLEKDKGKIKKLREKRGAGEVEMRASFLLDVCNGL